MFFWSMFRNVFGCYPKIIIHLIDHGSISTIDATIEFFFDFCPKQFSHYPKKFVADFRSQFMWLNIFGRHLNFFFWFLPNIFKSSNGRSFNLHHWSKNYFFLVFAQKHFDRFSKQFWLLFIFFGLPIRRFSIATRFKVIKWCNFQSPLTFFGKVD